ncbi:hypothetical protein BRD17_00435 [Halobacteriales archaeon SW_7_68_16]|nr:MAG: hypothetical protein BRD17_00435 [Halobacteriales archaeon SW_7_68_16]
MVVRPDRKRAIGTTVDVAIALLIVGAAVGIVAAAVPPSDDGGGDADAVATTLATGTTTVEYVVSDAGGGGDGSPRIARGTYARLLADAALANVTVDGRSIGTGSGYVETVADRVRTATATADGRVTVTARWQPYAGAPIGGRTRVGPSPPPAADVHAATLTVPTGRRNPVADNRTGGYDWLAAAVSRASVARLFPPVATGYALDDGRPASNRMRRRYRRAASGLGTSVRAALADADARRANRRLAAALAPRIERDLRTYATPRAAAQALTVDRVRIVVRTWTPEGGR